MYLKGGSRSNIKFWAAHLQNIKENTRAEIIQTRGVAPGSLRDMMLEMQQDASIAPRCKNFMYIASFNPCPQEQVSEEKRDQMIEIFEQERGIPTGQPRIIVEHEKHGRTHWHVLWLRVDLEKARAFPDGLDLKVCERAEQRIERELGLKKTPAFLDREPEDRPKPGPKFWEIERGKKTGVTVETVTAEITAIFRQSEHGADFVNSLQLHGYQVANGERGLCVLDQAGKVHSLARRIEDVNTKQLKAFMHGVDLSQVPSVEQAQAQFQQQKIEQLEAGLTGVQHEIAWEEKLAQAAIEKEQHKETGGRGKTNDAQHEQGAAPAATGPAQEIREARQHSDHPQAFIAALAEHGIDLAQATKADAVQSQLDSAEATIRGYWKPTFRAGEIVAVTERGQVWKLTERTTGDKDIHKFLTGLTAPLPSIQDAQHQRQRERELQAAKAEPGLNKTAGSIRLAYNLASGPEAFKEFLQRDGLIAARISTQAIHERDSGKEQREKDDVLRMLRNPAQVWMLQTGGIDALTPELRQRAAEAYERWSEEKPDLALKYDFGNYVGYVQTKWGELAKQHNIDVTKEPPPSLPEAEKKPRSLSGYAREGDIVILDKWGNAYELTNRTTGDTRQDAQAFLAGIGQLPAIEDARRELEENRRFGYEAPLETDIDLGKAAGQIRLAYNLTNGPEAFREYLQQDGLTVARVAWQDIRERDSAAQQENRQAVIQGWDRAKPHILDAEQSLPAAPEPGKPSGRLSDHAREGDIVILDKSGSAYELNQRTAGDARQDAQAFLAGMGGYLPSVATARRELEEQRQRPIQLPTGAQQGGLVAQQMWAVRRLQNAAHERHNEQRRAQEQERRAEERCDRQEAASKATGEVDPQRYLTDPDYRRQVRTERTFMTPEERKTEKENNLRALLEQQDRQR